MNDYPTRQYYTGNSSVHRRAVYKGIGLTDRDLNQPLIAVVNTFSEVCPGHHHLQSLVQSVKDGIWQEGATPLEFSTISQCATQTLGLDGIRYDLAARELIALDIETIVETQLFDGLVIVTTCDKTIPGALLAAARLDLPTVIVPGGIMRTGKLDGREVSLADLDEKVFSGKIDSMPPEEITRWENGVIPGDGACPIMGTANTMQSLSEALGVSLPFSSLQIAGTASQKRLAKLAGNRIVQLVRDNITFSRIATPQALQNMIKTAMALGAASNSVVHMLALSHDLGYQDEINIHYISQVSRQVPCVSDTKPVGGYYLTYLSEAGGVPAVMSRIETKLSTGCSTVTGQTIGDICRLGAAELQRSGSPVVRTIDDPVMENGGIIVLHGNLADSAVVRAFKHSKNRFEGTVKVYESQQEAVEAVKSGSVLPGDALVLRFMGPKGGPGMPDCFGVSAAVVGAGLEETVAVVTDGRFSGFAKGVGVCQICPEAASGGPLAKVRTGDRIVIDTQNGSIDDLAADFDQRPVVPAPDRHEKGMLRIYSMIAQEANRGARL